jgi:hypothetical protein
MIDLDQATQVSEHAGVAKRATPEEPVRIQFRTEPMLQGVEVALRRTRPETASAVP